MRCGVRSTACTCRGLGPGDAREIWGRYGEDMPRARAGSEGCGRRAAGGGRGVLLGYPLLARVVEPPAVQSELVPAVHHAAQRPARPRDDQCALGERAHAQAHDGALAWRQSELVLVELQVGRRPCRHRLPTVGRGRARIGVAAGGGGGRVRARELERAQLQGHVHRVVDLHLDVDPLALHARRVRRLGRDRRALLQPVAARAGGLLPLERRDERVPQRAALVRVRVRVRIRVS